MSRSISVFFRSILHNAVKSSCIQSLQRLSENKFLACFILRKCESGFSGPWCKTWNKVFRYSFKLIQSTQYINYFISIARFKWKNSFSNHSRPYATTPCPSLIRTVLNYEKHKFPSSLDANIKFTTSKAAKTHHRV